MFDDVCKLVSVQITKNEYLQEKATETLRQIYCRRDNITRAEFFSGGRMGIKPSFMLTVAKMDYDSEKEVEYNGKRYAVYRNYEVSDDYTELYCEEKGGVQ